MLINSHIKKSYTLQIWGNLDCFEVLTLNNLFLRGEFSYAKLEEKRSNRPGCFIIRESESKYNQYFIDICIKNWWVYI